MICLGYMTPLEMWCSHEGLVGVKLQLYLCLCDCHLETSELVGRL